MTKPSTRKEFRHCKHYDGQSIARGNPVCGAGVNPIEAFNGGEHFAWFKKAPCHEKNADAQECSCREFPTWEEVAEQERKMDLAFEAVLKILPLIPEDGARGEIECPICNGIVDWSRAESNGHRHAKCRTDDCIWFME